MNMNKQLEQQVNKEAEERYPVEHLDPVNHSRREAFKSGASFYASLTGDQAGRWVKASERLPEPPDDGEMSIRFRIIGTEDVFIVSVKKFGMLIDNELLYQCEWYESPSPSEPLREALEKIRDYKNPLMSGSDCYDEIQDIARKALSTIK